MQASWRRCMRTMGHSSSSGSDSLTGPGFSILALLDAPIAAKLNWTGFLAAEMPPPMRRTCRSRVRQGRSRVPERVRQPCADFRSVWVTRTRASHLVILGRKQCDMTFEIEVILPANSQSRPICRIGRPARPASMFAAFQFFSGLVTAIISVHLPPAHTVTCGRSLIAESDGPCLAFNGAARSRFRRHEANTRLCRRKQHASWGASDLLASASAWVIMHCLRGSAKLARGLASANKRQYDAL